MHLSTVATVDNPTNHRLAGDSNRSTGAAGSTRLDRPLDPLDPLARGVVRLVEAPAQQRDEVGHLVGGEPEGAGADVVAPQRQHDELRLLVPGHAQRAILSARVEEDRAGAG